MYEEEEVETEEQRHMGPGKETRFGWTVFVDSRCVEASAKYRSHEVATAAEETEGAFSHSLNLWSVPTPSVIVLRRSFVASLLVIQHCPQLLCSFRACDNARNDRGSSPNSLCVYVRRDACLSALSSAFLFTSFGGSTSLSQVDLASLS